MKLLSMGFKLTLTLLYILNHRLNQAVTMTSDCVIANQAKQNRSPHRFFPRDDAGFTLLELLMGVVLFSILSIGYFRDQRIEADINWTSIQAQRYQQVSTALGSFMSDNYSSIKALPPTCSNVVYAANQPKPNADFSTCTLTTRTTSSPVANGMQPTVAELIAGGYLSSGFNDSFVWPSLALVYQSYAGSFDASKTDYALAPVTYASQVQALCNSKPFSATNTCPNPELRSLVFNTQPFAENTNYFGMYRFERLSLMRETLGAKALMSYDDALKTDGQLYALGDKFFLDNPLVRYANSATPGTTFKGVEAILALHNKFNPGEIAK
jgi:prepilin-type N-terminal cleavage/methylation domain-containing protein